MCTSRGSISPTQIAASAYQVPQEQDNAQRLRGLAAGPAAHILTSPVGLSGSGSNKLGAAA